MPLPVSTVLSGRRLAKLFLVLLPFAAALASWPARAQDSDLRDLTDRVDRLQRELGDLERSIYNNQPAPAGNGSANPNSAAQMVLRIEQIEDQLRQLTGQVEELNHKYAELDQKLDRINADTDLRLKQLEGTAPAAAGAAPAPAAGTAPAPAAGTAPAASGGGAPTPVGAASAGAAPAAPAGGSAAPAGAAAAPSASTASAPAAPPPSSSGGVLGTITGKELAQQQATGPNRQAAATAAATSAASATAPSGGTAVAALPSGQLPAGSAQEQYQYAFGLLHQQDYPGAEAALRAFVAQHPNDPLAGNAQYWLGETYYVRKDYRQAAVAFAEGYQKYPTNSKAPDNLLKLGLALAQIGEKADACEALSQLGKQFPSAAQSLKDRAARERQRMGCK